MNTIYESAVIESPMTMCEQSITIMKQGDSQVKSVGIESPMTMCEQSITIMKQAGAQIRNVDIESPMTMCEQSIAILRCDINKDVNMLAGMATSISSTISGMEKYRVLNRMIA